MARYLLNRYWSTGEQIDVITAMASLSATRVAGATGKLVFALPYKRWFAENLEKGQEFTLFREGRLQFDTRYLFLDKRAFTNASGIRFIEVYAEDLNRLADTRIVAYHAGSPQADKTGCADDLMKAIVRENMGALASAERQIEGLTVEQDLSMARSVSKAFAWRTVGSVLADIGDMTAKDAQPAYWDFHGGEVGAVRFSTHVGWLGEDRRPYGVSPVLVGEQFGSLQGATTEWVGRDEVTAVYAGGQGQEENRVIKIVTDEERILKAFPYGRVETFMDARNVELEQSIEDQAREALGEAKPIVRVSGQLIETRGSRYDIDCRFGDFVTVESHGVSVDCMIKAVGLSMDATGERIDVQLEGVLR